MLILSHLDQDSAELWVKWWAEANERKPNGDLGKWLGVFVTLGVGMNVSILFGMW